MKIRLKITQSIKRYIAMAVLGLLVMAVLSGCSAASGERSNANAAAPNAASASNTAKGENIPIVTEAKVDTEDLNSTWDESTATKIQLNGSTSTLTGAGAAADGGTVTITQAGTYVISGALTNGQIAISATKDDLVHIILNGAAITNQSGAPIYASQCDKLVVTLAEGTENILTDGGADFVYADEAEKEPNAALFSKDDLTINGNGTLSVNAGFRNGIGTKDDLLIVSGTILVNAADHGIRGNDSITVLDGDIRITAATDGIQTNNTQDADKGWILIEGGSFQVVSVHDGIQSDGAITIKDGSFDINAGGGAAKAQAAASADTDSGSYKGLKAAGNIIILAGHIQIDSGDDSIHTNGNVTISSGEYTLASGDDGIHADGDFTVSGGTIKVTSSYEGLEGANIIITDGIVDVVSLDDGINAGGGTDQNADGGRFEKDQFSDGGNYSINIGGGNISIHASGDGIDSNGSLTVSGGTIISLIDSTPDNGAIDCDGAVTFTGGTVIYGGSGWVAASGTDSTQSYVYLDTGVKAGSDIIVKKAEKTLITFTPDQDLQYLALSSPDIISGESYDIYSKDTLLATVTAGTGGRSGMRGRKPDV